MNIKTKQGYQFEIREPERDLFIINEQFIENIYQLTAEKVKGKVIVDGGANIGSFSIHCDKLGAKKVLAFEPEPHNWTLLQKNLEANHVTSVVPYQLALTPENKEYVIVDEFGGSGLADWYTGIHEQGRSTCQGITLSEALKDVPYVDLLKLDIEKSEYPVLTQADDETLSKIKNIVMEFHEADVLVWGAMIARLSQSFEIDIRGRQGHGGLLFAKAYQ